MSDSADGVTRTGGPVADSPSQRGRRGRPRDPGVDVAIRTATVDLLGEIGYARLTMDEVAVRAGVAKASLYLRWPNKVALVADALQQRARTVPEVPDTGTLPADMRVFLTALLHARDAASRALSAVTGEIASNPELRAAWRHGVAGALTGCLPAWPVCPDPATPCPCRPAPPASPRPGWPPRSKARTPPPPRSSSPPAPTGR